MPRTRHRWARTCCCGAAGDLSGYAGFSRVAGWEGIFTGLSAMYLGIAQVLNESFGRTVLPIGPRT
jgi:hypothetical protein